jgi:predicted histone-like DNA-binding protein
MKYKVVQKGKPGNPAGVKGKYYANLILEEDVTTDSLIDYLTKTSSLNPVVCRQVFIALQYTLPELLAQGKRVKIDKIGSFYPSVRVAGEDEAKFLKPSKLKKFSIKFRPAVWLINEMMEKVGGMDKKY